MTGPHGETLVVDWGLAKIIDPQFWKRRYVDGAADSEGTFTYLDTTDGTCEFKAEEVTKSQSGESTHSSNTTHRHSDADLFHFDPSVTIAGTKIGSPGYMSPEQERGDHDALDARSDIFSLGKTLEAILGAHLPADDVHFQPVSRGVLESISGLAAAPDPNQRYQSAAELAQDIERYLANEKRIARDENILEKFARVSRKRRKWIEPTLIAGVAIAFIAVLANTLINNHRGNSRQVLGILQNVIDHPDTIYRPIDREIVEQIPQLRELINTLPDRKKRADAKNALGRCALGAGMTGTSIELLLEAQQEYKELQSDDLQPVIFNQTQLADAYSRAGYHERAIQLAQELAGQAELEFGKQDLLYLNALQVLSTAHRKLGQYSQAEQTAREMLKSLPNKPSNSRIRVINDIVASKLDTHQSSVPIPGRAEIEQLIAMAQAIGDELDVATNDWVAAEQIHNEGVFKWKTQQFSEACKRFEKAIKIRSKIVGPSHALVSQTAEHLARATLDDVLGDCKLKKYRGLEPKFDSYNSVRYMEELIAKYSSWGTDSPTTYVFRKRLATAYYHRWKEFRRRSDLIAAIGVVEAAIAESSASDFGAKHEITFGLMEYKYRLQWQLAKVSGDKSGVIQSLNDLESMEPLYEELRTSKASKLYSRQYVGLLKQLVEKFETSDLLQKKMEYEAKLKFVKNKMKQVPDASN